MSKTRNAKRAYEFNTYKALSGKLARELVKVKAENAALSKQLDPYLSLGRVGEIEQCLALAEVFRSERNEYRVIGTAEDIRRELRYARALLAVTESNKTKE